MYVGHFQMTAMPYGLMNSPPTFQKVMDLDLTGHPSARAYLDDNIVTSNSF